MANQSIFDDTETQIWLVKHEIEEINRDETKVAMIRARERWEMQAEMPTKYFLNLEKRNAERKNST